MWWVKIEPTTSWIDERVRRKIGEKNKCGEWGLNPQPFPYVRRLIDKLREKEWACGGLIPLSPCLQR